MATKEDYRAILLPGESFGVSQIARYKDRAHKKKLFKGEFITTVARSIDDPYYYYIDEGKQPACVVNCPGKARYFGDLDDPGSDVSVFLAAHPECEQIGLSGLYYRTVDGMPEGSIDQIVSA